MSAINERLTILSQAEQSALYDLPDFDDDQRANYLRLTHTEYELMKSRSLISSQVYCALQIGYFKAKYFFFRFSWDEIPTADIQFVLQKYFSEEKFNQQRITKYEYYLQCSKISLLFGYQLWQQRFESALNEKATQVISRDINPQFITLQLIDFLQTEKIVRPRYTTLQTVVRNSLSLERNRLKNIINSTMQDEEKSALKTLLSKSDTLLGLAAIKQDAKDFKARMMATEREKLEIAKPFYKIAKEILPKLNLSKQNINYYGSLINYYTIHDLRERIQAEQTYLYLLCYIWQRYCQFNDNLVDAFCYHFRQFYQKIKNKAREEFSEHLRDQNDQLIVMKQLVRFYVDKSIPDDSCFGDVREKAFTIMSEDNLIQAISQTDKPIREIDFRWKMVDRFAQQIKFHLRPLINSLEFKSNIVDSPWLKALEWFKATFSRHQSLAKRTLDECPIKTIPKRLRPFLVETNDKNEITKLRSERYEFWIYRQLFKRLNSGEIYLEDSIYHQSFNQHLVSLNQQHSILKQLDIPALQQPIKKLLSNKFAELHTLFITFNQNLKSGKLTHLHYDEKNETLHSKKAPSNKDSQLQHRFYEQLPLCDIIDVFKFVHEKCHFLSAFTNILPRYAKQSISENSLIAVIIAQAMNQGNLNMAAICDIDYHVLQETLQSCIRLQTLKTAHDIISHDIAQMPIFPLYSLDLAILYGGVDGQKFEVKTPTIKARYSKKYFKKGKGVVAFTMLANHIPLQVELIGAHEHESYFTFDIWYNNTSSIVPDIITGDMHCINKANFAIMDWFGGKLFPRFTNLENQRKHLFVSRDVTRYKSCIIQPAGQIDRRLIENEWPNLQRIIATLALKETTQSIFIKKLCAYQGINQTRKALFEYDKLVRAIHTLKYFLDPKIQRDTYHSQNRIEAYHQQRAAIAQAYGKKQLTGQTNLAIEISNQCARLVATAINHYNSSILSKMYLKCQQTQDKKGLRLLKKISPVAWAHLHFQGYLTFNKSKQLIDIDAITKPLSLK